MMINRATEAQSVARMRAALVTPPSERCYSCGEPAGIHTSDGVKTCHACDLLAKRQAAKGRRR